MFKHVQLCGSVKSWKRAQDPSNGKPKGFGFCEFESAEGILRATRLLNKLSLDGQELVVCIIAFFLGPNFIGEKCVLVFSFFGRAGCDIGNENCLRVAV
jgi:RNA recognition motif-containing protein